jgi:hypothetical protein
MAGNSAKAPRAGYNKSVKPQSSNVLAKAVCDTRRLLPKTATKI